MKRSLSLALVALFAFALANGRSPQVPTGWEVVHDYISEHSISAPAQVEAALYQESINEEKSWDVVSASSQATGFGPGWPGPSQSIVMPTLSEAQHLANLIDAFREGG